MKEQIELLTASYRTNLHMARTQCGRLRFESSRQYLENAKRDAQKIKEIKTEWAKDTTKVLTMRF